MSATGKLGHYAMSGLDPLIAIQKHRFLIQYKNYENILKQILWLYYFTCWTRSFQKYSSFHALVNLKHEHLERTGFEIPMSFVIITV